MPVPSARRRSGAGRLAAALGLAALASCCLSTGLLAWLAPRPLTASPVSNVAQAGRAGRDSARIALQARGGAEDWRAYASTLPVPPGYAGPVYSGPASVNDAFIDSLLAMYKAQSGSLPMKYVYEMAADVLEILKSEKSLQRVPVPPGAKVTVVGDLHGQYFDFHHMITTVSGKPSPQNPILFNGDFVDRGVWSVEVLMCLYAFKLQHPTAVHFNRGNHETEMTNYQYGFAGEVEVKYEKKLMELFSETFRYLPLATVLENQVFVAHAGVPGPENRLWEEWFQKAPDEAAGVLLRNSQVTLAQIESTNRVVEPNPDEAPLVIDFLWSDPKGANGYGPSVRVPMVYNYGPDIATNFLNANGLKYMIRSHETKSAGWQQSLPNVYTVFSAPNYIDRAGNKAAVAVVTNQGGSLVPEFKDFVHQPHPEIESGAYSPGKSLAPAR